MVIESSPASDLAVYRDPVFERAYRGSLREAFALGPAGYARDTVLALGRWPFDLASIDVPVDLWYGDQDTGHSPDQGEWLAARIPGAVRHLVPGIGGAVLWTHAEQILRNFAFGPRDVLILISTSGIREVIIEMAEAAKRSRSRRGVGRLDRFTTGHLHLFTGVPKR